MEAAVKFLRIKNPVLNLVQWAHYSSEIDFIPPSIGPKDNYDKKTSCVFTAQLPYLSFTFTDGTPIAAESFIVWLTILPGKMVSKHTNRYGNELEDQPFFKEFFRIHPNQIEFMECNGGKCRRSLDFGDTGIWCRSCHSDLDWVSSLTEIFRDYIEFNDLPASSILYVHKETQPFDSKNQKMVEKLKEFVVSDYNTFRTLKTRVSTDYYEKQKEAALAMIEKQKVTEEKHLQELQSKYGNFDFM